MTGPTTALQWCLSPNLGDALSPWLVRLLTGGRVGYADRGPRFIVTGSMLNHADGDAVVWGAGLASSKDRVHPKADIRAVRGPLSRQIALSCGASCPEVYGDPALLVRLILPRRPAPHDSPQLLFNPLVVVPHYIDYLGALALFDESSIVLDVLGPIEEVCRVIASSMAVITSSLHGLVIAHAYGVPALWVRFGDRILGDGTKYRDHLAAMGLPAYEPVEAAAHDAARLKEMAVATPYPPLSLVDERIAGLLRSFPLPLDPLVWRERRAP